ncbi:beta-alanine transporter-like isoform X1 [Dermacentor albipictus]|uniref:beta-alanine transporter-like isoform X1 n=1 Tax=Dermacentor albipictus TaxID=60249 RepID=UPI0031FBD970
MDLDELLPEIGAFGPYQKWTYFLLCIPATLPSVFTLFNSIFVSATPRHWCRVPEMEALGEAFPPALLVELSIPRRAGRGFESCRMYDLNYTALVHRVLDEGTLPQPNESWPTRACDDGWVYDATYYDDTLVTQMNVVCDDAWKVSMAQCAFYIGSVVGNLLFGFIGDRWGRKKSFLLTIVVSLVGGIGAAFPVTYEGYIAWRGVVGMTYPAIFQTPFIMSMEIMSPEKRTFAGMFVCAIYGVALMTLAGVAYLLRSWFPVAVATSLPFVVLLAIWWLIPESPRWLLSQDRLAEAEILLQKIAKRNGKKISPNFLATFMEQKKELCCDETATEEKVTLQRLVQYPNLLKKVVVVCFSWTANTVVYNGLSFAVSSMGISDYVSFTISGAVEVPGVCLAWYFMDRHGRRPVMLFNMVLGGLACIATIFVPSEIAWPTVALCSLGKLSITASFATIYVYGAELFPTVLRTLAMGIAAMTASISLIITPQILYMGQIYGVVVPSSIFGAMSVAGGLAILLLPETMKVRLPQTLSEGEAFGKDVQSCSCFRSRTSEEDSDKSKQGKQHQETLSL